MSLTTVQVDVGRGSILGGCGLVWLAGCQRDLQRQSDCPIGLVVAHGWISALSRLSSCAECIARDTGDVTSGALAIARRAIVLRIKTPENASCFFRVSLSLSPQVLPPRRTRCVPQVLLGLLVPPG